MNLINFHVGMSSTIVNLSTSSRYQILNRFDIRIANQGGFELALITAAQLKVNFGLSEDWIFFLLLIQLC